MALDFDAYLNKLEAKKLYESQQIQDLDDDDSPAYKNVIRKRKKETKDPDKIVIRSTVAFAKGIFNDTFKRHLKENPQYRELQEQITVLTNMRKAYKSAGQNEHAEKCASEIEALTSKRKDFEDVLKNNSLNPEEAEAKRKQVEESQVIKTISAEIQRLKKAISFSKPSELIRKLREVRVLAEFSNSAFISLNDDDEDNEVIDFDDLTFQQLDDESFNETFTSEGRMYNKSEIKASYEEILQRVSEITNISVSKLKSMETSEIANKINTIMKSTEDYSNDVENMTETITELEAKLFVEKNKIYNNTVSIENLFMKYRDYYDIDGEAIKAKELLAASYYSYIEKCAYNICKKADNYELMPDAIGYGCLELARAVDKWHDAQKETKEPISIRPMLKAIRLTMMRSVMGLDRGGMITGTNVATNSHKYNKIKKALEAEYALMNPDMSKQAIEDLVNNVLSTSSKYDNPIINTESDYSASVSGGDSGIEGEAWDNLNIDDDRVNDSESLYDVQEAYKDLVKIIMLILKAKDGNKPLLTQEDYLIFLMRYGFMLKEDEEGFLRNYRQDEMAEEIIKLYKQKGITKTIGQSAISTKFKVFDEKMKQIFSNPKNKQVTSSMKYIMKVFAENRQIVEYLSLNDPRFDLTKLYRGI